MEELTPEEVAGAIDSAIAELLEAAGIAAPPVDAIALAQGHLGMVVCMDSGQRQRGRAQRLSGQRQIYLRPEPTEERHQWTVAHEIGEHSKTAILERLRIDPADTQAMTGESLANLFAFRLLVPTLWFHEDAPALGYDLLDLKKRYRTASHEVIAFRMLDLSAPCIVTIVDNERIHRRRSNTWRTRKQLHPAEEKCRRHVYEHGEPCHVREGGWSVWCWPVHQLGWKREILRSQVEEGME